MDKQFKLSLEFVIPADRVLKIAQGVLKSDNQEHRDIAKALLDTTAVSKSMQARVEATAPTDETCDFAPYFDHWIGDALETAQRLIHCKDQDVKDVARCLIDQSNAIANSKLAFLKEAKRLGVKRSNDEPS